MPVMASDTQPAPTHRIVGVEAGAHQVSTLERVVVCDGGVLTSTQDAERITCEHGLAEGVVPAGAVRVAPGSARLVGVSSTRGAASCAFV